ncbi:MAG: CHAT domain-containing protein, partial [Gemmataceae bacterium]
TDLARRAVKRSLDRVLPLERSQKQLPGDTALVFWLDVAGKHMGCVVRRQGPPVWVVLPGTGKRGRWREEDSTLPARTLAALADKTIATATRLNLVDELKGQRIAPLLPHLEKMKHLLVVPAGVMSAVPLEALTDNFTISYVPSASFFARGMEKHRPLEHAPLLVLDDPDFQRPDSGQPAAPARVLLFKLVLPESLAARAGLRPGDVLLEYDSRPFARATDLESVADSKEQVSLKFWRDGIVLRSRIGSGKLGVIVDERPVNEALAKWRKQSGELSLLRGDKAWPPLPGTRLEARSLTALVNKSTLLQGSQANEERLAKLAAADELKQFRLLHLATHGEANALQPAETALILAQNQVPAKPKSGRLTVRTVLKDWELDADLVVLSACQSGLGKATAGDGMLGFTQALLQKGARSVVLSRWKVDDTATALLMVRFYENLLGRREGLKQPLERAEALAEAKTWLRTLTRDQAEHHLASLVQGVPRGERGTIKAALPTRQPEETKPQQDRPFAHPYYWAAFILLGDPR